MFLEQVEIRGFVRAALVAKARQRLGHTTRPPAGGAVLAAKVVEQWRREPSLLDGALAPGVLEEAWVDRMVSGAVSPDPSTVAFVLNLSALQVDRAGATRG